MVLNCTVYESYSKKNQLSTVLYIYHYNHANNNDCESRIFDIKDSSCNCRGDLRCIECRHFCIKYEYININTVQYNQARQQMPDSYTYNDSD